MHIAICCQNGREVSAHPGKCTRFILVDTDSGQAQWLTLPADAMLRQATLDTHPLRRCQAVLARDGGADLARRLAALGVTLALTTQAEPGAAVAAHLAGDSLPALRAGKGVCTPA